MSYLEKETQLQEMINTGKLLEAYEKFYNEEVTMIEPTGQTFHNKSEGRKHEEEFLGKIEEFHGSGTEKITSNEEEATTMTESWMDVTFKGASRMKMEQVSVKQWKGDQIVHERFYYNPG